MGRKCAVPHCYTGYRKCKEKASLYRVPDDDFFLSKWQEAIAREDRPITPKDYVCEKHFNDDDILRKRTIRDVVEVYQRPRLKPDAIPSIFPDLPEFILKMVKKRRKMPPEDAKSSETNDLPKNENHDNEDAEQNTSEQIGTQKEIKSEPSDTEKSENLASATCETTLNNEVDIKSEPEEHNTDHSVEDEEENETNDPDFGPKMHQCDQCDYQTKYPHNLRTHKTKHLTGEEAYMHCEHCPNYKTKWELTFRNHLKIKHGIGKQEVFKCSLCNFETKVKLCLKRHSERHQQASKAIPCDFPDRDYKNEDKGNLALHKLSHKLDVNPDTTTESAKNFRCTECLYETNSKTHIIRHIKTTHNAGDDTVVSVNIHKKIKSPEDSNATEKSLYKCLKCSYKSKSQSCLLKHVFKHKYPKTTRRPKANVWKCPKCPFATFFQHALQRHRDANCGDLFTCKECNFKSSHKPDFIKHSLTHRNISVESVRRQGFVKESAELCITKLTQTCSKGVTGVQLEETKTNNEFKNVDSGENVANTVPEFVTVKNEVPDDLE